MISELKNRIDEYFAGKEDVTENVLICLLAGGHVLLEDVPGVGKTTLARTVAKAVSASFGRIQFTPDTLPSDVSGVSVYDMKSGAFTYREGAVSHQILLADEINRTSPKTQASLLEAMEEHQVTVDNVTHKLPEPFLVIATQNPVEYLGTYPLPEAQLDRFMMKLSIGYPSEEEEIRMTRNQIEHKTVNEMQAVTDAEAIISAKKEVEKVHVSDEVLAYIRRVVDGTRNEEKLVLGASPRAMIQLTRAAQAKAYLSERDFVTPDDVKAVAVPVLHHRLSLTAEARIQKETVDTIIAGILSRTRVIA